MYQAESWPHFEQMKPFGQRYFAIVAAQAFSVPKRFCHSNKLIGGIFIMKSSFNRLISS
jgi:hypothetical protein